MGDKETTKRCSVCGYKATGKNFGAVSCEPCKAFFRRNALKNTLKCHLDNNCKLDQITRRFCSKCRLNKCLAVGMRRDLILNDEEREMKRLKILENKKKKDNSFNSNDESLESLIDSSQETSLGNDISNTNNNTNNDILCEILDDNHFSADALNQQIMEIESTVSKDFIDNIVDNSFDNTINDQQIGVYNNCNEINSQSDYNVSNETIEKAVEFAVSVVPIARPLSECKTGFNVTEIYLLIEMKTCTKFLGAPMSTNIKSLDTMYDIHQSFTTKYDTSIRDQTKAVKWLSAFRNICCEDQISLLKYGCFDIIFLRSIMYFDYTDNTLKVPMDTEHSIVVKVDYLKNIDYYYKPYIKFVQKMADIWDTDITILDLMSSITLFNPDRPNLANRNVIKLQQHIYMHLLQRYLQLKYRSKCEAMSRFLILMNIIMDLNVLREAMRKLIMEDTPKTLIPPLVEEVFDITPVC